jgi:uncharacterized protein (TIGR03000 family)
VVSLPPGVKLTINGWATASGTWRFITPPLEPDSVYFYTMTADLGWGEVQTQRVSFRAGQEVPVSFSPQTAQR